MRSSSAPAPASASAVRLVAALVLLPLLALPLRGADDEPGVAARAGETTVSWSELDDLLFVRHANSPEGREALKHLLKTRLLEQLAEEAGLRVGEEEIDALWAETERGLREAGQGSLEDLLAEQGMSVAEFRDFLRLGVVQRTLAKRALGIPEDDPVSGELQETWLEGVISERGLEEPPPPWKGGLVLRCGEVEITVEDHLENLRRRIDPAAIREGLEQALLEKRLRARMPDLSDDALERAVRQELERRRANVRSDPRYKGIGYDELMKAKGVLIEMWPRDPAVRVAALAQLWVERRYDEDALRRVYEDDREYFDGVYGEAIETWILFLRAGLFENELVPRTFEDAEKEIVQLTRAVRSPEDFEVIVMEHSEATKSRDLRGRVGFVTRLGSKVPAILRDAIFRRYDDGAYSPDLERGDRRRLTPPIRTSEGVAICWLGDRRPTPAWDEMIVHVHTELRVRVQEDSLDADSVVTYLDTE